ncbi:MAG: MarR family transcriptional regulator [Ectothiorhodospiraceae bacterium]|nr:MarR family transcriptional regulator [Ectothiorhodospiraceae bacterium]MCH8504907.1 MarR family transcriptional regulator [Ectothiorhodospiraceae bacterium]
MPRPSKSNVAAAQEERLKNIHDTLAHRPGFLIRRLHQIHIALFLEECAEFKVTPVQYSIMTALRDSELDQRTIANSVGIDRATTAEVLRRLEKSGWLRRRRSPEDGRRRIASLSDEGRALLDNMDCKAQRAHERTVEPLRKRERERFLAYLARLVDANNEYGRAPMDLSETR